MTTEQSSDLMYWLPYANTSPKPLPESLKNVFIERCLEELKNSEEARNRFNSISPNKISGLNKQIKNGDSLFYCMFTIESVLFEGAGFNNGAIKLQLIQTLLSRTPDGQAVMPFLDVEVKNQLPDSITILEDDKTHVMWKANGTVRVWYVDSTGEAPEIMALKYNNLAKNTKHMLENILPKFNIIKKEYAKRLTLDHLLYREFTEALRVGKTFEKALEIVTKTYLLNFYV